MPLMRVYLDLCCLKRPFDSQAHPVVRLETEAVLAPGDPGSGNYTEERAALLPDLSIEELTAEVERIQGAKGFRSEPG